MKQIFLSILAATAVFASVLPASAQPASSLPTRPETIYVGGQPGHVQGIAYDDATGLMYMSFTTVFLVVDKAGTIVGSVDRIHGHLGAMTFDPVSRKVYASLECKDDEIGAPISNRLGLEHYAQSAFYVAEIDVDKISGLNVPMDDVMQRHEIVPANLDYNASVEIGGKTIQHRYGCSGIDGVTVGPAFGGGKGRFLYVAYGIYSDTTRTDNDYQILLQYKVGDLSKPLKKIFVKTGNTSYGVQNLAYDSFSNRMIMAVYTGKKSQYPNYSHFALDMGGKLRKAKLDGVPYENAKVWTADVCGGWFYKYGSTGFCPLGDGYWYVSEPSKTKDENGKKVNNCLARLYKLGDYLR